MIDSILINLAFVLGMIATVVAVVYMARRLHLPYWVAPRQLPGLWLGIVFFALLGDFATNDPITVRSVLTQLLSSGVMVVALFAIDRALRWAIAHPVK
jgi:hypothetical protein